MRKEIINADEYKFLIKVMPHKMGHGLYLIHEDKENHLLKQAWSVNDCRDFIFEHFIGEKGTKFNIEIQEGKVMEDEHGLLYLEAQK